MKNVLMYSLLGVGAFGCAAPQAVQPAQAAQPVQPAQSADETSALKDRIAHLESEIATLNNRIGHLQSDIEAASSDNEFTTMTIDGVKWGDQAFLGGMHGSEHMLLLHPVEWRGYGKMKRFTDKSDHVFYLEADGKPRVEADALVGGVCNTDGSTRYVMVQPSAPLEPGVSYHLRPRNDNEAYKWSTSDALVVSVPSATR